MNGNAMWLGKIGPSLTLQDAPAAQARPLTRQPTTRGRSLQSFRNVMFFSFPWARKPAVLCLFMRDMFVVTLMEEAIKMLLFRICHKHYSWDSLEIRSPANPLELITWRRKHSHSPGKKVTPACKIMDSPT